MVANFEEDDCFGDVESRVHTVWYAGAIRSNGRGREASGSRNRCEDAVLQSEEEDSHTSLINHVLKYDSEHSATDRQL